MKKKSTLIGLHDMVTLNNAYFLHSATDNVFVYHRKKQTAEISSFLYLYNVIFPYLMFMNSAFGQQLLEKHYRYMLFAIT